MRKARFYTIIVIWVPLLALVIGTLFFLHRLLYSAMRDLPQIISVLVTERVKGNVKIGSVDTLPNGLVLHDVVVSDGPGHPPLLKAPQISIVADVKSVILGRVDPVESIEKIDLVRPEIYLERKADGRLSIIDFLKPYPAKRKPVWHAAINIKSGRLILRDLTRGPAETMENIFTEVGGSVQLGKTVRWMVTGLGNPGRLGKFVSQGKYVPVAHSFDEDISVKDANAQFWTSYPLKVGLNVPSGFADGTAHFSREGLEKPFRYTAALNVRDAALKFKAFSDSITAIKGKVDIKDGVIGLRLNAKLGRTPIACKGFVIGTKDPHLTLDMTSDHVDFKQFSGFTKFKDQFAKATLPTSGNAQVHLFGMPKSLGLGFSVNAPSVAYHSLEGKSIAGKGVYFNHRISLERVTGTMCGGQVDLSGDMALTGNTTVVLSGRAHGFKVGQLAALGSHGVDATADGDFQFQWSPGNTDVRFKGSLADGRLGRIAIDKGAISGRYLNGNVEIQELSGNTFGGFAAATGSIGGDGSLSLHIAGSNVDLNSVSRMYFGYATAGRGQFSGDLSGTLSAPIFNGQVEAYKVKIAGVGLERIAGGVSANRNKIELSKVTAFDNPGTAVVNGSIDLPLGMTPVVNLDIRADSINIDKFLGELGYQYPVHGLASARMTVSGKVFDPKASIALQVDKPAYSNMAFDLLKLTASYENGGLNVDNFSLSFGDSLFTAKGKMGTDERLSVIFNCDKFPLSETFNLTKDYASLFGDVNISGIVTGTRADPHVDATLKGEHLIINGQDFAELKGSISWDRLNTAVSNLSLIDGPSEYSVSDVKFDPASEVIKINAIVRNGNGRKLFDVLDSSAYSIAQPLMHTFFTRVPRPISGIVNASVTGSIGLDGVGANPDLQCDASITDIKYGSNSLKSLHAQGTLKNGTLEVKKIEALEGDMNLSADGKLTASGDIGLKIDAHSVSIDMLRQWVKVPENFSGRADVTLVASGKTDAPQSEMYIELVDPVLNGVKYDRLRGRLSSEGGGPGANPARLNIDDITLVLQDQSLKVSGHIPVDWKTFAMPTAGDILLETKLDAGSMKIISAFTGLQMANDAGGVFQGDVKLVGTVGSPALAGKITWNKGRVSIPRVETELQNISANVTLQNEKISIERHTGQSALGGDFSVTGQMAFLAAKPSIDINIRATNLDITTRNLSNTYGEHVKAKLSADVKVSGDLREPLLAGKVSIPDGLIESISQASKRGANQTPLVDPKFALDVYLGKHMEFRSGRLISPLYGKIALAGSLSKPVVNGTLDVTDGRILFPLHQLRVMPGSTISLHAAPQQPPSVYIDISAQARASTISLTGRSKIYTITMTAKGPMDNIHPVFSSSPPDLSEQNIISVLAGEQQLNALSADTRTSDINKIFSFAVVPTIFQSVGNVVQTVFGLEEFGIETGYNQPYRLTIGEQIWKNFYLDYARVVGARPDYTDSLSQFTLSYRFKKGLELDLSVDEKDMMTYGIQGRTTF